MTTTTVYVELLGEGITVWRPVEAEVLPGDRYRLRAGPDYDAAVETWAYGPGTVVRCRQQDLGSGPVPVVVEAVPS